MTHAITQSVTQWSPSWLSHLDDRYRFVIVRCANGSRRVVPYGGGWIVETLSDGTWSAMSSDDGVRVFDSERAAAEEVERLMVEYGR